MKIVVVLYRIFAGPKPKLYLSVGLLSILIYVDLLYCRRPENSVICRFWFGAWQEILIVKLHVLTVFRYIISYGLRYYNSYHVSICRIVALSVCPFVALSVCRDLCGKGHAPPLLSRDNVVYNLASMMQGYSLGLGPAS